MGRFHFRSLQRERPVGARAQAGIGWSPRSGFPEKRSREVRVCPSQQLKVSGFLLEIQVVPRIDSP